MTMCIFVLYQGYILTAGGSLFEELDPSKRSGTVLLQGVKDAITAISAHPLQVYTSLNTLRLYLEHIV
jgi:hypothetical protein